MEYRGMVLMVACVLGCVFGAVIFCRATNVITLGSGFYIVTNYHGLTWLSVALAVLSAIGLVYIVAMPIVNRLFSG